MDELANTARVPCQITDLPSPPPLHAMTHACSIAKQYDGMIPLAINAAQYEGSMMCGACIEGRGTGRGAGGNPITGSFKGFVMDQCPECAHGVSLAFEGFSVKARSTCVLRITVLFRLPPPAANSVSKNHCEGHHEHATVLGLYEQLLYHHVTDRANFVCGQDDNAPIEIYVLYDADSGACGMFSRAPSTVGRGGGPHVRV